jgi:hypothetical protein
MFRLEFVKSMFAALVGIMPQKRGKLVLGLFSGRRFFGTWPRKRAHVRLQEVSLRTCYLSGICCGAEFVASRAGEAGGLKSEA